MPSLNALGEFRDSFNNIANEKDDVVSSDLPFDNLDLPTTEPPPFNPVSADLSSSDSIFDDSSGTGADAGAGADVGADSGGLPSFDFNAFINTLPGGDAPTPSIDDILTDVNPPSGDTPSFDDLMNGMPPGDSDTSGDVPSFDDLMSGMSPGDGDKDTSGDTPSFDDLMSGMSSGESEKDTSGDTPSFDDLMNGLSTDESGSDAPDAITDEVPSENGSAEADDFSIPKQLLNGLSDEIEASPPDFPPEENPPEDEEPLSFGINGDDVPLPFAPAGDTDDLGTDSLGGDLGGLPDFNFGDDGSAEPQPSPEIDEHDAHLADALNLGGERQDGSFSDGSTDDLPDMQLPADTSTPDFDIPESADIDFGADASAESAAESDDALGGEIDLGGEVPPDLDAAAPSDNFVLDDVLPPDGDFSTGDASSDFGDLTLPDGGFPPADAGAGFDDMTFHSGDSPDADASAGFDDMTFPTGDSSDAGAMPDFGSDETLPYLAPHEESGDLPSFGDLGGDFASDNIELDTEGGSEAGTGESAEIDFDGDDFHIPGLDDIFDKGKKTVAPPPVQKRGLFGRRKKQAVEEEIISEDEVEEIQLSQEDLDKLLTTLTAYPLNLRIACEELIAEQVLAPQQLSKLIRYLIRGVPAKDAAEFAGELLGKTIIIPRSFEKSSGAAWEEEKASFAYIFVHNFLPVLRLFAFIAAMAASVIYLGYKFVYIPIKAESLYKRGYERISAGEYQRANELFHEAFLTHRKKKWFYTYATGFRDERRYMLAEAKYDELLRYYPRDKRGVLEYAHLETYYLLNYDKANRLLQQQLLDYAPNDYDGLLAAGDNFLLWADSDPSRFYDKYEDARFSYARILELKGWQVPIVERMLAYFIRTDNLKEVLFLRNWFDSDRKRKLSPETIAELGGYLLDKQIAAASGEVKGVPNPYVESIESVRAMLLQAVMEKPELPEPHYHLARYYKNLGNVYEERLTLENAIRAFDLAKSETVRRRLYRVDTHYRYANMLINNREFFPADVQIVRGIELYEDFLSRNIIPPSVQLGQLYALKGDLEYFVKTGNMQLALNDYHTAEKYGYTPPEIQYRMGAAYYYLENWKPALEYLFKASKDLPLNRKLLFALGNTAFKRGDYYAAQGYYSRLLDILDYQRIRLPATLPNDRPEFLEFGERLMMAYNNAGVVYEALAGQTGNRDYRTRAISLYAESARAWDSITRNPSTMSRMRLLDTPGAPGVNLGFLNASNAMRPVSGFNPEIFLRIDKDVLEPSHWEELAPFGGLVN